MALVTCLYCRAAVSGAARNCPKCKNSLPAGVPCAFCGDCLRKEDAVRFRGGPVDTLPPLFEGAAHASCVEQFWVLRGLRCRDCGTSLIDALTPAEALSLPHAPCSNGGCTTPLGWHLPSCYYCGRGILPTQEQGPPRQRGGDYDGPTQYDSCHNFCDQAQARLSEFHRSWFGI
jgi:hypothetical protein